MNDNENNNWLKYKDDTYSKFAYSISKWPFASIEKASKSVKKNIILQKQRLDHFGIKLESINEADDFSDSISFILSKRFASNNNSTFNNTTHFVTAYKTMNYYKGNELLNSFKYSNKLCANVTSVNDEQKVLNKLDNCPNCGAVLSVQELLNGCKYCHTKFTIDDLYPVITNYYVLPYVSDRDSLKNGAIKIGSFICTILFCLICFYINYDGNMIQNILIYTICSPFVYFAFAFILNISSSIYVMIKYAKASKYGAPYSKTHKSKKIIEKFMAQYDEKFTYLLFEGKIISKLKDEFFKSNSKFENIIDCEYCGGMSVNKLYEENDNVFLDLNVYFYNTIYENEKINKVKQIYRVVLTRDKTAKTTSDIHIAGINCKNCGANIDVDNDIKCKYCGSEYNLEKYDFVVLNVELSNETF